MPTTESAGAVPRRDLAAPLGRGTDRAAKILVTPEEAAHRLSISRTVLYRLMSSGDIRSVLIGRSRRIPVSAIEDFVADLSGVTGVDVTLEDLAGARYARPEKRGTTR